MGVLSAIKAALSPSSTKPCGATKLIDGEKRICVRNLGHPGLHASAYLNLSTIKGVVTDRKWEWGPDPSVTVTARVYQRKDGMYEWRLVAENGEIIATSGGQGYTREPDAVRAWKRVKDLVRQATLVLEDA